MKKIHIDTDLGGDIDDLCALAMVLRWPYVELTGITTVAEDNGRRAGYVRYVLDLERRGNIPVAAGAEISCGFYRDLPGFLPEEAYWPEAVARSPGALEDASDLLKGSIEQGATIVAIGPLTNLYLLDIQHPNILMEADLVLMGGYIYPPRASFPQWANEMDYNIQVDVRSARHVIEHTHPLLVPLSITTETYLRRLQASGALGQLIGRQAEAFAVDEQFEARNGATYTGLPVDIINFQHDPLACAIALGWRECVEIEEVPLALEEGGGWIAERVVASGRSTRLVRRVNGARFSEFWLDLLSRGPVKAEPGSEK